MSSEAWIILIAGIAVILLSWSGILGKLPRGRRRAQMMGETNAKLLDTVVGVILIIVALFFL